MPSEITRTEMTAREGKPYWSVHHLQYPDGSDPVASELSGVATAEIGYTVYDLGGDDPTTAIVTANLDKSVSWFDTLQTDGFWDSEDDDGYNFRGKIPSTAFPNGAGSYKVEYSASTSKTDAGGVTFDALAWEEYVTVVERFDA